MRRPLHESSAAFMLSLAGAAATVATWQPAPGYVQVSIRPGAVSDAPPAPEPEQVETRPRTIGIIEASR